MTTTTSSSRNPIKGERLFDRTFARLLASHPAPEWAEQWGYMGIA